MGIPDDRAAFVNQAADRIQSLARSLEEIRREDAGLGHVTRFVEKLEADAKAFVDFVKSNGAPIKG